MKNLFVSALVSFSTVFSWITDSAAKQVDYFDSAESGVKTGGVKMIPIITPSDTFKVWTKRFGNNPNIKVLLLHGGPGGTHEQLECFESFFPREGIEFYEYDQLGSYYSDQPNDTTLWRVERMVDEVEQVRKALGLDKNNFYLLGHSWGGLLAMHYALAHQEHLKGLIVCNIFSSATTQNAYMQEILKGIDPLGAKELLDLDDRKDFDNPHYFELLVNHIYKHRGLRMDEFPEPMARAMKHYNAEPDRIMLGRSALRIGGQLEKMEIFDALSTIQTPTLMVGGKYDFVDPKHMEAMSAKMQRGQYLLCPNGSHNAIWDDQEILMTGIIKFIKEVKMK
jgi:proline iminopeptidase